MIRARIQGGSVSDQTPESGSFILRTPDGDNRQRLVCVDCGFIRYENPKVVVGAVCSWKERILLCRRAIDPRKGYWTLPAGFLELNESTWEGVRREAMEEANARLALEGVLAVYDLPRISQVQIIYRARLLSPDVSPGPESEEVALFRWEEIPWEELAFPTVRWALEHDRETRGKTSFPARRNPEPGPDRSR